MKEPEKHKGYIFLDFDDVMFNTSIQHIKFNNLYFGINSKPEDYENSEVIDVIKKYRPDFAQSYYEMWFNIMNNFHMSYEWQGKIQPLPRMTEVVRALSQKYNLLVPTGRPQNSREVINWLLEKHVPGCISQVHCVYAFSGGEIFVQPKTDFVKSIVGEKIAFIDDSKNEINKMQAKLDNKPVSYLFDSQESYATTNQVFKCLRSWEEIGQRFL